MKSVKPAKPDAYATSFDDELLNAENYQPNLNQASLAPPSDDFIEIENQKGTEERQSQSSRVAAVVVNPRQYFNLHTVTDY